MYMYSSGRYGDSGQFWKVKILKRIVNNITCFYCSFWRQTIKAFEIPPRGIMVLLKIWFIFYNLIGQRLKHGRLYVHEYSALSSKNPFCFQI